MNYNIFIIPLLVILCIIFGAMVVLFWLNRGSLQSYDLLWPIIGGILAATFFFLKTFYTPLPEINNRTNFLILNNNCVIIDLPLKIATKVMPKPSNGYRHVVTEHLSHISRLQKLKKDEENDEIGYGYNYYFDLLEWSSLTWISQNYPNHWQITRDWFDGISSGGGSISVAPNAEKNVKKISISKLLEHNLITKYYTKDKGGPYMYVPEGTSIAYKKINSGYSKLIFKNKNIVFTISFSIKGGGGLGASELAEKLKSSKAYGETKHYSVDFDSSSVRWRRFSPRTTLQLQWVKDLTNFYNESFSWDSLKTNLEKNL